ncbi:MAG: methylated-DNA--[protein]-cysteine S-methyltransferase [Desulfovibrionaceae bacterium]
MLYLFTYDTAIGKISLAESEGFISHLHFGTALRVEGAHVHESPLLREAIRQVDAYLAGNLRTFTLPLHTGGTFFQQAVWQALCAIPYGETCSYGAIAARLNNPGAARAVGLANNRNPIAVIIPCHRVIGAKGALVGYAGGLGIKEYLLALEARCKHSV